MRITAASKLALMFWSMLLLGCSNDQQAPQLVDKAPPYIVAVNNPLQYFAQRLIGQVNDPVIEVRLLAPADIDPAQWRPTAADVLQMQGAELVLLNGAGYSGWLDKVAISPGKLVVTSESAKDQWLALDGQLTHSHGPGGEHAHSGYAFTTWMDMSLARVQAEAVAVALQQRWPQHSDAIATNRQALDRDLDALDSAYREQAARLTGRNLIYSHPVYQYFERRYALPGTSLHWEPDVMPTEQQWGSLQQLADDSSVFVWEAQPAPALQQRMTGMGLMSVVIDPAGNVGDGDWLSVQKDNVARMAALPLD